MSFIKRRLRITINLGEGQFGETRGPDVTLTGYRAQVSVVAYNADVQSSLQMRIFGLSQDMINRLTVIGPIYQERRVNRILIEAGDDNDVLSVLYEGTIYQAWADYNQAPEVSFNILGYAAADKAVKPVPPRSYVGATPVAVVMRDIAASMGLAFRNSGVRAMLSSPYFPGTDIDQLVSCAQAARINYLIEKGMLYIWNERGSRDDPPIQINPETNLIGYPNFTGDGIEFNILYTPAIGAGKKVQVTSVIEAAHGEWTVVALSHHLESEVPGGAWLTKLLCRRIENE